MSLQDESFPDDEFLDELDFSANSGKRFQFPKNRCSDSKAPLAYASNTSGSSADQNISSESTNERPASDLSGKTNASDPTGLTDINCNKAENENKAISYMDIHSEYTKRRFKHVESKVGQYIASMKAEDQKRRNSTKFQRHRSMPETLCEPAPTSNTSNRATMRFSAAELRKFCESTSDVDADSSKNTTSSSRNHHESSGEDNFVDKKAYDQLLGEKERIQSYSDYLQSKLDDKNSEVLRLKRNVDYLRIELSNYKDKIKKNSTGTTSNNYNSAASFGGLGRQTSLQAFANCQLKYSKATQTEMITLSPQSQQRLLSCDMCVTPETPDNNNNTFQNHVPSDDALSTLTTTISKSNKCVAAIQPLALSFSNVIDQDNSHGNQSKNGILRQRTNSNQMCDPPRHNNNSDRSNPSSSDSAIDIESAELNSPKPQSFRRDKIYLCDKRLLRHNTLEVLNTTYIDCIYNENGVPPTATDRNSKTDAKKQKKNSLRWRMLRIFGPCARCSDQNQSLDVSGLERTFTQIPLLEKSPESFCRTMR